MREKNNKLLIYTATVTMHICTITIAILDIHFFFFLLTYATNDAVALTRNNKSERTEVGMVTPRSSPKLFIMCPFSLTQKDHY